jgi:hypothetical protein
MLSMHPPACIASDCDGIVHFSSEILSAVHSEHVAAEMAGVHHGTAAPSISIQISVGPLTSLSYFFSGLTHLLPSFDKQGVTCMFILIFFKVRNYSFIKDPYMLLVIRCACISPARSLARLLVPQANTNTVLCRRSLTPP